MTREELILALVIDGWKDVTDVNPAPPKNYIKMSKNSMHFAIAGRNDYFKVVIGSNSFYGVDKNAFDTILDKVHKMEQDLQSNKASLQ